MSAIVKFPAGFGLAVSAGLHTGECELAGGEVGGAALHLAERVRERARPSEVLASSAVHELTAGSSLAFEELEARLTTGPGHCWRLYRAAAVPPRPERAAEPVALEAARAPGTPSRRGREVAALIARGCTNRRIADELCISPATVARHVANILGKLGFSSRTQIAALAVAHDLARPALA